MEKTRLIWQKTTALRCTTCTYVHLGFSLSANFTYVNVGVRVACWQLRMRMCGNFSDHAQNYAYAFYLLVCLKLCWHNVRVPIYLPIAFRYSRLGTRYSHLHTSLGKMLCLLAHVNIWSMMFHLSWSASSYRMVMFPRCWNIDKNMMFKYNLKWLKHSKILCLNGHAETHVYLTFIDISMYWKIVKHHAYLSIYMDELWEISIQNDEESSCSHILANYSTCGPRAMQWLL